MVVEWRAYLKYVLATHAGKAMQDPLFLRSRAKAVIAQPPSGSSL